MSTGNPAVTTDVVIFSILDSRLQVLLVKRGREPFRGSWALPGGFVGPEEDLEVSAQRVLEEETGVTGVYLEQLYTFGRPARDPRRRVVSVAYYALVPPEPLAVRPPSDDEDVAWFPLGDLPALAFDHGEIAEVARQRLSAKLAYSTIALQFMPEEFTLGELQNVYEIILDRSLDKRNFRKQVLSLGQVEETGDVRRNCNHRPARLYRVSNPGEVHIIK